MTAFNVRLTFHGDLTFFLRPRSAHLERHLSERTSVKDIIEGCGVPHTEVDLILVEGAPANFSRVIASESDIEVFPVEPEPITAFPENRLQVRNVRKFVADGHLGKLVRDLRLLGIDVTYDRDANDPRLVEISSSEERALLTRDRRLLMHSALRHGYYLRSQNPLHQTVEVIRRFNLANSFAPFGRCLLCNAVLELAAKESVIQELEPLTRIYYDQFRRCPECGQVYWSGSHFEKLQKRIEAIQTRIKAEVVR
ncbi:MAG TPA: Mut7-C RNAse domain-containing protein [Chthoniobacterales bacterium]|nr:Mut7-C RNAse domain-containing protein [Chthoniobacterales bacterium]